jgi:hypothetical protein
MWENTREEGSRRLKANAVPTVFNFSTPQRKRKAPLKRSLLPSSETEINISENLTISTSTSGGSSGVAEWAVPTQNQMTYFFLILFSFLNLSIIYLMICY